jgi:hypothetical protein
MGKEAKAVLEVETLEAVADRGYWDREEILACDQAGVTVTLPKPMTSSAKFKGRFVQGPLRSRAASASRTSSTCRRRTLIAARPVRNCGTTTAMSSVG